MTLHETLPITSLFYHQAASGIEGGSSDRMKSVVDNWRQFAFFMYLAQHWNKVAAGIDGPLVANWGRINYLTAGFHSKAVCAGRPLA
ncbi:hypothetical protein SCLCIDRAFT_1221564 [Scleroderma citrinum Foug A]|uniref:Uncharacterized protein n=1 Tax=Scleroderma citrinum Foug A TaxID=1036808 RepID=A0A0C3DEZ2_9AGAM|nr:hypothetical protein SCLCIDRAFT_1221564 [Scleroderma citrinum Foug A]